MTKQSEFQTYDDPVAVVAALRDVLTQVVHAFAAVNETRARASVENIWTRIDAKLVDRGVSENDRLNIRSMIDRAEARSNIIDKIDRPS